MEKSLFSCRATGNLLTKVLDFGKQPLGNGFIAPAYAGEEYFYDMACGFDEKGKLFQLLEQPSPERMFHSDYAFITGTSTKMVEHFRGVAESLSDLYLRGASNPLVIEIGCNDGTFLHNVASRGVGHIGVEPSTNVADIARSKGLNVVSEFFSMDLARDIKKSHQSCHLIYASNVMCHIPEINEIFLAVCELIAADGVFVFEDPYLGDVIERCSYDQIYDEHVFLFSAISVDYICGLHGLELINVERVWTHGGSMRFHVAKKGRFPRAGSVDTVISEEMRLGLHRIETFLSFAKKVHDSRTQLRDLLLAEKAQGRNVLAYGATSKSTTIYNFCAIDASLISKIVDNTPTKIGKLSPGVHIPIVDRQSLDISESDTIFLAAWNHREEILLKESRLTSNGVRWISHVPGVGYIHD